MSHSTNSSGYYDILNSNNIYFSLKQNSYEKKVRDLLAIATVVDHSKSPCETNFIPETKVSYTYKYFLNNKNKYETSNLNIIYKSRQTQSLVFLSSTKFGPSILSSKCTF